MPHQIDRQALYDRVWVTPLKQIAPEFGVDPMQLSEICKRYVVPTPPAGYWTKLELGKPAERTPLGPAPDGLGDTIDIEPKPTAAAGKPLVPRVRLVLALALSFARNDENILPT